MKIEQKTEDIEKKIILQLMRLDTETGYEKVDKKRWRRSLYIKDQFSDLDIKNQARLMRKYHKHVYTFTPPHLLEAFIIHYLYFSFLGPTIFIVAFFYWPYFQLFENMQFLYGDCWSYLGTLIWVGSLASFFGHYDREYPLMDFTPLIMQQAAIVLFSCSIASKYGTFCKEYRQRLLRIDITPEESEELHLLGSWSNQRSYVIKREIKFSIRRKYVDISTFKVSFIEAPSRELRRKLEDMSKVSCSDYVENNVYYFMPGNERIRYYDARVILFRLLEFHKLMYKNRVKGIVFLATLFFGVMPFLSRIDQGLEAVEGDILEITLFVFSTLMFTLCFCVVCLTFSVAFKDNDRQRFCLQQLQQMISPAKITDIEFKLFPTLNLSDPITIQSWLNLFKMVNNYGVNFMVRHQIFMHAMIFVSSISMACMLAGGWVFSRVDKRVLIRIQSVLFYIFSTTGGMALILVYQSWKINSSVLRVMFSVAENQQVYQTLHNFRDYYIKGIQDKEIPFDINQVFREKPMSITHDYVRKWMRLVLKSKYEEFCDPLIEKLVDIQKDTVKEIKREIRFHYKSVFGLQVDFWLVGGLAIIFGISLVYGYLRVFLEI